MKIRFYEGFSFLNILISLLIVNSIVVICCPIHIGLLYFFKVPISNIIYHLQQCSYIELLNNPYMDLPFFISNFLVIYLIPICSILLVTENFLLKFGKISQKENNNIINSINFCNFGLFSIFGRLDSYHDTLFA